MGSMSDHDDGMTVKELEDQLMGVRIKEADTLAELKEMRQKVPLSGRQSFISRFR